MAHEVTESAFELHIGDVGAVDLIRMKDGNATQEIGILLVLRICDGCALFRVNRLQSHKTHESLDMFSADTDFFIFQVSPHAS